MICDLSRADIPWVRYYNYKQKLSMNPVVDILRHEPWEHRVVSRLSPMGPYDMGGADANFGGLCHWWLENDYPVNDIECLELDQAPRMPVMDSAYINDFNPGSPDGLTPEALQWLSAHPNDSLARWVAQAGPAARLWRLTNTRYLFCEATVLPAILNRYADPPDSFKVVLRVNITMKPGISVPEDAGDMTVQPDPQGALALIEDTRALPRAKLYADWKTLDDTATLQQLNSRRFDPEKTVLVATDTPVSQSPANPGTDPGSVRIIRYQSKDIILEADAKTAAVLLLNDHIGDFWNVWVDQKPGTVLRCNYIMQGVFVPAGQHRIEFRFQPPQKMLCVSLSAFAFGILLGGYATFTHFFRTTRP
jgi:hypothetical protein